MGGDLLISVLLPTRGRPGLLRESVGSLFETATKDFAPSQFEVLYAVDTDDDETLDLMLGDLLRTGVDRVKVYPERLGYARLHEYINGLVEHARGRWLLLWNDDAIMQTYGWDAEIARWPDRYVLDLWSNHEPRTCAFPCVPAWWVRKLGHFSLNAHNDTWWQEIGERTRRLVRIEVDVLHRRFDLFGDEALNDATYQEKLTQHATADFYTERNMDRVAQDARVVQELMVAQYQARWRGEADWEHEGRVDRAR